MNAFTHHASGIGAGDVTVVFVPALFAGGWIWDHPARALRASGRPVLVLDEPVCAVDPRIAGSIERLGDEVIASCDAAGATRIVVCANSLGGLVALDLADRFPDRVAAIAISGAPGLTPDPDVGLGMDRRTGNTPRGPEFEERMLAALFHRGRHFTDDQLRECGDLLATPASMVSMARSLRATRSYPIRETIERITVPTRLIWGAHDRMTPVDSWVPVAEGAPTCELDVIEDCGHIPMLEKPEHYTASLVRFLDGAVGDGHPHAVGAAPGARP